MLTQNLSPQSAVDQLVALHAKATASLKSCLDRYFKTRQPPSPEERRSFCYPQLRVIYEAHGVQPNIARAFAKFQGSGTYVTTVTQPAHFRRYLTDQLTFLVKDYAATIEVGISDQEIPYPYVLDRGDDLGGEGTTAAELALHFPVPRRSWQPHLDADVGVGRRSQPRGDAAERGQGSERVGRGRIA